jgi:hypothetical protein
VPLIVSFIYIFIGNMVILLCIQVTKKPLTLVLIIFTLKDIQVIALFI